MMRDFYEAEGLEFDPSASSGALATLIQNPALGRVVLLRDGDATAGYFVLALGYSLEFHGRDAFIDELYLSNQYRGRGWGLRAMEHAEEVAQVLGVRALHLEVNRSNEAAQSLYRKLGYRDHDRYLMTKSL